MTNKYLTKIASDLEIAKKYEKEEKTEVKKYTEEMKDVKNPTLKKALKYVMPQEKVHAEKFEQSVKAIKQVQK